MAGAELRSFGEQLERRLALTGMMFVSHTLPIELIGEVVEIGDVDSDGDFDFVVSAPSGIVWFESTGSATDSYVQHSIGNFVAKDLRFADLDGDGVNELVAAIQGDRLDILALKYDAGMGTFLEPLSIATLSANVLPDLSVIDLDSDGDLDLLVDGSSSLSDTNIVWLRNDGALAFTPVSIAANIDAINPAVETTDVDGDGDLDVLVSFDRFLNIGWPVPSPPAGPDSLFAWYELAEDDFVRHSLSIDPIPGFNSGSELQDFDGDGDLDFIRTSFFLQPGESDFTLTLGWFENDAGNFGNEIVVDSFAAPGGLTFSVPMLVEDFDFDGSPEVVVGVEEVGVVAYVKDGGTALTFSSLPTQFEGADVSSLDAVDFDGDQDLDVVMVADGRLHWLENRLAGDLDGNNVVDFADFLQLIASFGQDVEPWTLADLDGDGTVAFADFLILSANFGETRAIEDVPRLQPIPIFSLPQGASFLVADVDGDGENLDFFVEDNGVVTWREQSSNGFRQENVTFAPRPTFTPTSLVGAMKSRFGDTELLILAESRQEILRWQQRPNGTWVWANEPCVIPEANFDPCAITIHGEFFAFPEEAVMADLGNNSSGGFVVPSGGPDGGQITFFRGFTDSTGYTFVDEPKQLLPADLDGDGDTDLVVTFGRAEPTRRIIWFEREFLRFNIHTMTPFDSGSGYTGRVALLDFDGDDDLDLVESVLPDEGAPGLEVRINDGAGGFSVPTRVRDLEVTELFADPRGGGLIGANPMTGEIFRLTLQQGSGNELEVLANGYGSGLVVLDTPDPLFDVVYVDDAGEIFGLNLD